MNLEDRIGVSTISLAGIGPEQAIDAIAEAGFKSVEMLASVATHCAIGYPDLLRPSSGVWPRAWDATGRARLKEKLKPFSIVTLHAQLEGVNVASWNPGIREESVKQYLECIDLAHDIGATVCTFHPSNPCRYEQYVKYHKEEGDRYNLEFAKSAVEHARGYDMKLGFEGTHNAGWPILDMIMKMPPDDFGILIDPAQSCNRGPTPEELVQAIHKCRGRIVEVHVHGSLRRTVGTIAHLPLRMSNIVNWADVMSALDEVGFDGPFMFEITSSEDYRSVLKDCQVSKALVIQYQDEIR